MRNKRFWFINFLFVALVAILCMPSVIFCKAQADTSSLLGKLKNYTEGGSSYTYVYFGEYPQSQVGSAAVDSANLTGVDDFSVLCQLINNVRNKATDFLSCSVGDFYPANDVAPTSFSINGNSYQISFDSVTKYYTLHTDIGSTYKAGTKFHAYNQAVDTYCKYGSNTYSYGGNSYSINIDGGLDQQGGIFGGFDGNDILNDGSVRINDGKVYLYKVEPIKWRVIDTRDNNAILIADSILDSYNWMSSSRNPSLYYASDIAHWLDKYDNGYTTNNVNAYSFGARSFSDEEYSVLRQMSSSYPAYTYNFFQSSSYRVWIGGLGGESVGDYSSILSGSGLRVQQGNEYVNTKLSYTDYSSATSNNSSLYWLNSYNSGSNSYAYGGSGKNPWPQNGVSNVLKCTFGVVPIVWVDLASENLSSVIKLSGSNAGYNFFGELEPLALNVANIDLTAATAMETDTYNFYTGQNIAGANIQVVYYDKGSGYLEYDVSYSDFPSGGFLAVLYQSGGSDKIVSATANLVSDGSFKLKIESGAAFSFYYFYQGKLYSCLDVTEYPSIFVDPDNGNDGYDGMKASYDGSSGPVRTLQQAITLVQEGATISLLRGLIYEYGGTSDDGLFDTNTAGRLILNPTDKSFHLVVRDASLTPVGTTILNINTKNSNVFVDINNVTFDGQETSSTTSLIMFAGQSNSRLTLNNVVMQNARCSSEGGALRVISSINNPTIYGYPILQIVSSDFTNNQATSGGAIYAEGLFQCAITDSNFAGNQATNGDGGAVIIFPVDREKEINDSRIERSIFRNNTATKLSGTGGDGGALYLGYINITNISSGCVFENNQATKGKGGAIYSLSMLKNTQSTGEVLFKNNSATNGGAIYTTKTINNDGSQYYKMTFDDNSASGRGMAIYFDYTPTQASATETINYCDFTNHDYSVSNGTSEVIYVAYNQQMTSATFFYVYGCNLYANSSTDNAGIRCDLLSTGLAGKSNIYIQNSIFGSTRSVHDSDKANSGKTIIDIVQQENNKGEIVVQLLGGTEVCNNSATDSVIKCILNQTDGNAFMLKGNVCYNSSTNDIINIALKDSGVFEVEERVVYIENNMASRDVLRIDAGNSFNLNIKNTIEFNSNGTLTSRVGGKVVNVVAGNYSTFLFTSDFNFSDNYSVGDVCYMQTGNNSYFSARSVVQFFNNNSSSGRIFYINAGDNFAPIATYENKYTFYAMNIGTNNTDVGNEAYSDVFLLVAGRCSSVVFESTTNVYDNISNNGDILSIQLGDGSNVKDSMLIVKEVWSFTNNTSKGNVLSVAGENYATFEQKYSDTARIFSGNTSTAGAIMNVDLGAHSTADFYGTTRFTSNSAKTMILNIQLGAASIINSDTDFSRELYANHNISDDSVVVISIGQDINEEPGASFSKLEIKYNFAKNSVLKLNMPRGHFTSETGQIAYNILTGDESKGLVHIVDLSSCNFYVYSAAVNPEIYDEGIIGNCPTSYKESASGTSTATSLGTAGGIYVEHGMTDLSLTAYLYNCVGSTSNAVYVADGQKVVFLNCIFSYSGRQLEVVANNSSNWAGTFGNYTSTDNAKVVRYDKTKTNTFRECIFSYNQSDLRGGALYIASGDNVSIIDCKFHHNSSQSGGAIYSAQDLTITNTRLTEIYNNQSSSTGNGGAIYVVGNFTARKIKSFDNICNGTATTNRKGGFVYATGNVELTDCVFGTNSLPNTDLSENYGSARQGGYVYSVGDLIIQTNAYSEENYFVNKGNATDGGAFYAEGNFELTNYYVLGCSATKGGVAYVKGNVSINNCKFGYATPLVSSTPGHGNSAEQYGGVLYVDSKTSDIQINRSNFYNNYALSAGGVIYSTTKHTTYITGKTPYVVAEDPSSNNVFFGNRSNGIAGIVYTSGSVSIANVDFKNNYTLGGNSIVYIRYYDGDELLDYEINLNNCLIERTNVGDSYAGSYSSRNYGLFGMNVGLSDDLSLEENFTNVIFNNNTMAHTTTLDAYTTPLVVAERTIANFEDCIFMNNFNGRRVNTERYGGTLLVLNGGKAYIKGTEEDKSIIGGADTSVYSAFLAAKGGSIYVENGGTLEIDKTTIGEYVVNGETIVFAMSDDNSENGVVYCENGAIVNVSNSKIIGNSCGNGVFYFESDIRFENCEFTNNVTDTNGSVMRIAPSAVATVYNCRFINNITSASNSKGGAIYVAGKLVMANSIINGSLSDLGGAIYFVDGSVSSLTNVAITNCVSRDQGILYVEGGAFVLLKACNIFDNKVNIDNPASGTIVQGVAIANWGNLTIQNSTLNNNYCNVSPSADESKVSLYGYALYCDGGGSVKVDSVDVIYSLNKNYNQAYAVYVNNVPQIAIENCSFQVASSALYVNSPTQGVANLYIKNSLFTSKINDVQKTINNQSFVELQDCNATIVSSDFSYISSNVTQFKMFKIQTSSDKITSFEMTDCVTSNCELNDGYLFNLSAQNVSFVDDDFTSCTIGYLSGFNLNCQQLSFIRCYFEDNQIVNSADEVHSIVKVNDSSEKATDVTIEKCMFISNNGGASTSNAYCIYVKLINSVSNVNLYDCKFDGNGTNYSLGAIYVDAVPNVEIEKSFVAQNGVCLSGAVYLAGNSKLVLFRDALVQISSNNKNLVLSSENNNLLLRGPLANESLIKAGFVAEPNSFVVAIMVGNKPMSHLYAKYFGADNANYCVKVEDDKIVVVKTTENWILLSSTEHIITNDVTYITPSTNRAHGIKVSSKEFVAYCSLDNYSVQFKHADGNWYDESELYSAVNEYQVTYRIISGGNVYEKDTSNNDLQFTLKICTQSLYVNKSPIVLVQFGQTLQQAIIEGAQVVNDNGDAVSGIWSFADGDKNTIVGESTLDAIYALRFTPYNTTLYQGSTLVANVKLNASYDVVYYKSNGFAATENGTSIGISKLNEMAKYLNDNASIVFVDTYSITSGNEIIVLNKTINFVRKSADKPIISLANDYSFSISGGSGKVIIDGNLLGSSHQGVHVIENSGKMILGSGVVIRNFENNAVENSYSIVYNKAGGYLILDGCEISRCLSSNGHGGAVYNQGLMVINSGRFYSNQSANNGGFIYNTSELSINGSLIYNNKANNGGAIYSVGSSSNLSNVYLNGGEIMDNEAIYVEAQGGGKAGAVYGADYTKFVVGATLIYGNMAHEETSIYNVDNSKIITLSGRSAEELMLALNQTNGRAVLSVANNLEAKNIDLISSLVLAFALACLFAPSLILIILSRKPIVLRKK